MSLFKKKYKTLSHAVLAGNLGAARKLLERGADPNECDPDDSAWPIHYAINHGPEMVQLLVDHGADVNIPGRGNATPLAKAESRGFTEIAAILRSAGANLKCDDDDLSVDPRLRLQLTPQIGQFVLFARINFPTDPPEMIADKVESKLNLQFPPNMSQEQRDVFRKDVRTLILRECREK